MHIVRLETRVIHGSADVAKYFAESKVRKGMRKSVGVFTDGD